MLCVSLITFEFPEKGICVLIFTILHGKSMQVWVTTHSLNVPILSDKGNLTLLTLLVNAFILNFRIHLDNDSQRECSSGEVSCLFCLHWALVTFSSVS